MIFCCTLCIDSHEHWLLNYFGLISLYRINFWFDTGKNTLKKWTRELTLTHTGDHKVNCHQIQLCGMNQQFIPVLLINLIRFFFSCCFFLLLHFVLCFVSIWYSLVLVPFVLFCSILLSIVIYYNWSVKP